MTRRSYKIIVRLRLFSLLVFVGLSLASCHASKKATQQGYSVPKASAPSAAANKPGQTPSSKGHLTHLDHSRKKLLRETYGKLLDVSPSKIKNYPLYQFIDEWYGVRYKLGGSDQSGIDCSAFAQQLYKNVFGATLVRTSGQQYKASRHKRRVRRLKEGDLIFFDGGGDNISHVGVYLKNGYFVHASTSKGVMISNLHDTYWKKSFAAGGKLKRR